MLQIERQSPRWATWVIVILTIVAPALGGSTTLWAQATIILATSVLFILAPPRRSLGPALNIIFIAISAAALIAFLPPRFLPAPAWRTALTRIGVSLPSTWSPQPWL